MPADQGSRPALWSSLCSCPADLARDSTPHVSVLGFTWSELQADRGQTLALSWGSWSLRVFFFFLQSSTKNLKGSVTQGVSEDPQTWFGVSQHLGFIPAFNYCLSHRDLILRSTDDGAP